jgi:hypothetical protein
VSFTFAFAPAKRANREWPQVMVKHLFILKSHCVINLAKTSPLFGKTMAMSCIKSRILQGIIDRIEGHPVSEELEEMLERIRRILDLPRMVPEIALTSDRVTPEHFLQWDPQVFLPGPIWNSVLFPPGRAVTESEIYLFVAVIFFVNNKMRDGEPRVWRELIQAWNSTFCLAPGESRPNVSAGRYGSLLGQEHPWTEQALDCAISGESGLLTRGEENWLKDCLRYYVSLDSMEKVLEVRESMVTEGPRWWRSPDNGDIVWIPKRYWGANGR